MSSNSKKSQCLGMPHGTASARLRKAILFKLVQETNQDTCYRCHKKIETVGTLSIDHKNPWENRDPALFWDLSNIAFSHVKCNRPHVYGAHQLRKIGPEGTAWCSNCKFFRKVQEFDKQKTRWNGYSAICKPCKVIENAKRSR